MQNIFVELKLQVFLGIQHSVLDPQSASLHPKCASAFQNSSIKCGSVLAFMHAIESDASCVCFDSLLSFALNSYVCEFAVLLKTMCF